MIVRKSVNKEIAKIDIKIRHRIRDSIDELAFNPIPQQSKKLFNSNDNWRLRVGNYRIIYSIVDNILIIEIIRVAHRREVYRK